LLLLLLLLILGNLNRWRKTPMSSQSKIFSGNGMFMDTYQGVKAARYEAHTGYVFQAASRKDGDLQFDGETIPERGRIDATEDRSGFAIPVKQHYSPMSATFNGLDPPQAGRRGELKEVGVLSKMGRTVHTA
jgi:hypothetical protein